MFVRLLRMELVVDRIDEARDLFVKDIIPLCRKQDGFRGAHFLKDPKSGHCVAMTLWNTEAAMLANERSRFFQEQVAKFLKYFAAVPIRETYEVVVNDKPA
jgi:heme-degrading monooxygenase HmoA